MKNKRRDGRIGRMVSLENITSRFVNETKNPYLELPLIQKHLTELLGEAAAKQISSVSIEGQTLILRVTDPLWYKALSQGGESLLSRVQAYVPRLRSVIWRNV